jgi:hypothetical protein
LHWFLSKLKGTFEIILWSSLSRGITDQIVTHIQRKNNYFNFVLSRDETMNFDDRRPINIALAQATLQSAQNAEQRSLMDVSFSRIDKSIQPPSNIKDLTLLLDGRKMDTIVSVDCSENALKYIQNSCLKVKLNVSSLIDSNF